MSKLYYLRDLEGKAARIKEDLAANAAAKAAAGAEAGFPPRENMRATALKQFDKDGDGKLNDEERKAAMEARAAAPGKVIPAK
jgi:hypothetical protein